MTSTEFLIGFCFFILGVCVASEFVNWRWRQKAKRKPRQAKWNKGENYHVLTNTAYFHLLLASQIGRGRRIKNERNKDQMDGKRIK
jgi:chloramphenicol 3-O-phosphotransferase